MTKLERPNILLIIADDLGFSDIGPFGAEIHTPNLNRLAAEGIRFTQFHTAAACSPTRSMILTGTDNHLVGLGAMYETIVLPDGAKKYGGKPGHVGFLDKNAATLPEVLTDAGYHTILSGKWHLGNTEAEMPHARGFARDWTFAWGAANHYAWEPQLRQGDPHDDRFALQLKGFATKDHMYAKNGQWFDQKPNFPIEPGGYYSSDKITDELLGFLKERQSSEDLRSKPFFAYHAFTAPHWPLQSPRSVREKYRGVYDEGPEVLRSRRLRRLKELGLVPEDVQPHSVENYQSEPHWSRMSSDSQVKSARAMEAYAGMVEVIDMNIGKVINQLEDDGELENTVIVFMSDNGAEGAALEASPVMGPTWQHVLHKYYDNSLDNIGEPNSFAWCGPFWAQASTAPSRLWKMHSSEGGIRVPLIMRLPVRFRSGSPFASSEHAAISHEFGTCMDLMPTFIDFAGHSHHITPQRSNDAGRGPYKDRNGVLPMSGKSWVPWLQGQEGSIHPQGACTGWELHGRAALRQDQWKILWMPQPVGKGRWELFDLSKDPGENRDLADELPDRLHEMLKEWDQYVVQKGIVWGLGGDPDYRNNPAFGNEDDFISDPEAWMKMPIRSEQK